MFSIDQYKHHWHRDVHQRSIHRFSLFALRLQNFSGVQTRCWEAREIAGLLIAKCGTQWNFWGELLCSTRKHWEVESTVWKSTETSHQSSTKWYCYIWIIVKTMLWSTVLGLCRTGVGLEWVVPGHTFVEKFCCRMRIRTPMLMECEVLGEKRDNRWGTDKRSIRASKIA